jgi:hypothetical protein
VFILDKNHDPNQVLVDIPLYYNRRHSSLDTSVVYNSRPKLSVYQLTRVKEET